MNEDIKQIYEKLKIYEKRISIIEKKISKKQNKASIVTQVEKEMPNHSSPHIYISPSYLQMRNSNTAGRSRKIKNKSQKRKTYKKK
jgi:hypothetical protein